MKRLRLQVLLMLVTILGITGFQLFWLKQTYDREENSLVLKTDKIFRDAIQDLQVVKLKLDLLPDSASRNAQINLVINDSTNQHYDVKLDGGKRAIISTINVMRKRAGDTLLLRDSSVQTGMFITKDQAFFKRKLSLPIPPAGDNTTFSKDHIFQVLYGVDSLQDSLKIPEINASLRKRLDQAGISVPFTVTRADSIYKPREEDINEVTVGFAHPIIYRLKLGNSFSYLLKQISLPVLFSVLLLGITIISFVMLYRNLLQQKRLTEIKNEFIGNITHELKTPIATVSVAIEAMKNFNALNNPERTQEYLDISANELQRLSLLVDKVLSLSKFQQNEIEIKKEKFDLLQLIKDVLESMKPQFEKQHVAISLQTSGNNFIIEADERHISSVVYNLLDNALKYSKEDPRIDILLADQSQYLELRVTDNGIGIADEYKKKIFDQFFRVPHGDKHNAKGYGLGLSYVNYILKSHQGFIEVESELGKGSTFIVKLPFTEACVINYDKGRVIKKDFKV